MGVSFIGNPYEQEYESEEMELGEVILNILGVEDEDDSDIEYSGVESDGSDPDFNPAEVDDDYNSAGDEEDDDEDNDVGVDQSDLLGFYDSDADLDDIDYVTYPLTYQTSLESDKINENTTIADTDSD